MSQTLLQSDNMSVIGGIHRSKTYLSITENEVKKEALYLHLIFTVHVNGKLKSFSHYLELEDINNKDEDTQVCQTASYSLKQWDGWNFIVNTLRAMGYLVNPDYTEDMPLDS